MNFLEHIFDNLARAGSRAVLAEAHPEGPSTCSGTELLARISAARGFLRRQGLTKGDRCALVAHNSIAWIALDLALTAEGIIVVPLYARQAPRELAWMVRDAGASLVCAGEASLAESLRAEWLATAPRASTAAAGDGKPLPRAALLAEVFASAETVSAPPNALADTDPVTIIYTSGTSGEPKGVVLSAGNVNFMLGSTTRRLDQLMRGRSRTESVFHYAPLCFAGSWISLLSYLSRRSMLTVSTDLSRLAAEIKAANPHYFLNVPALLERMRRGIEGKIAERGGFVATHFNRAEAAWMVRHGEEGKPAGARPSVFSLWLARIAIFPAIRKMIGPRLVGLICGSAPLARSTQLFFMMLDIAVLQVYGLTETTAICTMDDPQHVEAGWVGPAIPGIEMRLGAGEEILVRGPNIFPGYWNRPQLTAEVMRDGWFHTGDQGEVNARGNWRITGRIKNLIVLSSGHNIAPEPIEDQLLAMLAGAEQVVVTGHGRSFLVAIVTGSADRALVSAAIATLNAEMPHYKRIHAFHLERQAFTVEGGLLTAMGKLKREAIAARFAAQLEACYNGKTP